MSLSAFLRLALLPLLLLPAQVGAAPVRPRAGIPTNIQAGRMEYNAVRQTVVFLGNVHVTRPDFELRSKKLTVFLKKKDGSDPSSSVTEDMRAGEVDRLVAENEVRLKSENRFGECEKATYYSDSDKVVMEGSPVLSNPDITIRGEVITHFLRENRTQVGKVVNATFQTPDRSAVQESGGQSTSSSGDR